MVNSMFKLGDEVTVIVYVNRVSQGEVVSKMVDVDAQAVSVYVSNERELRCLVEALGAAYHATNYHLEKPDIHKLIAKRIAEELLTEIAEQEGKPPCPTDDLGASPF